MINDLQTFLTGCDCRNLIQFIGAYYDDGTIKIVLEYMDQGSLRNTISEMYGSKQISYLVNEHFLATVACEVRRRGEDGRMNGDFEGVGVLAHREASDASGHQAREHPVEQQGVVEVDGFRDQQAVGEDLCDHKHFRGHFDLHVA
jgi:hypothetical protein